MSDRPRLEQSQPVPVVCPLDVLRSAQPALDAQPHPHEVLDERGEIAAVAAADFEGVAVDPEHGRRGLAGDEGFAQSVDHLHPGGVRITERVSGEHDTRELGGGH